MRLGCVLVIGLLVLGVWLIQGWRDYRWLWIEYNWL